MSDLIVNYRDHYRGKKFYAHGPDLDQPLGFLVKGYPGVSLELERAEFSGLLNNTADNNDIANCVLVLVDEKGNPGVPVLESSQDDGTGAGTTTTTETGLTMVADEHANRWIYVRTGDQAGQVRLITANTTGGQITHVAFAQALADDDEISVLVGRTTDPLWDTNRPVAITSGWRVQNDGSPQCANLSHKYSQLTLPKGSGIGFFSIVQDNFTGAFDYVQWTEMQIDVHGVEAGAGGQTSSGRNTQLQPAGTP